MYHFNRKGEPTEKYKQALLDYVSQIQAEENSAKA